MAWILKQGARLRSFCFADPLWFLVSHIYPRPAHHLVCTDLCLRHRFSMAGYCSIDIRACRSDLRTALYDHALRYRLYESPDRKLLRCLAWGLFIWYNRFLYSDMVAFRRPGDFSGHVALAHWRKGCSPEWCEYKGDQGLIRNCRTYFHNQVKWTPAFPFACPFSNAHLRLYI